MKLNIPRAFDSVFQVVQIKKDNRQILRESKKKDDTSSRYLGYKKKECQQKVNLKNEQY